jgi:hypothetical protein
VEQQPGFGHCILYVDLTRADLDVACVRVVAERPEVSRGRRRIGALPGQIVLLVASSPRVLSAAEIHGNPPQATTNAHTATARTNSSR